MNKKHIQNNIIKNLALGSIVILFTSFFFCNKTNKIADIPSMSGTIYIQHNLKNSKNIKIKKNNILLLNQYITSKEKSIALLNFNNSFKIYLFPKSKFIINKIKDILQITLIQGKIFISKLSVAKKRKKIIIVLNRSKSIVVNSNLLVSTSHQKDIYSILAGRIKIQQNKYKNTTYISDVNQTTLIEKDKEVVVSVLSKKTRLLLQKINNELN